MVKKNRGLATVVVLMVIGLVAMIASALVMMGSNNLIYSHSAGESLKAEMAAQAGMAHASRRLARDQTFTGWSTQQALPGGGANYTVSVTGAGGTAPAPSTLGTVPAAHFYLLARGITENGTVRAVGRLVTRDESNFPAAVFGGDKIEFKNSASTDTWNSSVLPGTYSGTKVVGAGAAHVQTNSVASGAVSFNGSGQKLDPDGSSVPTGDLLTPTGAATVTGTGTIFRAQRTAAPRPTPPVNMDGQNTSGATDKTNASDFLVPLPPGTYKDVNVPAGSALILEPGTYYFHKLEVQNGARIELPVGAVSKSMIKIETDLNMFDGSSINNLLMKPDMLEFQVRTGTVTLYGSEETQACYATVYAPTQIIKLNKSGSVGGHFFGALTGRDVTLEQDCQVHFDKALQSQTGSTGALKIVTTQHF